MSSSGEIPRSSDEPTAVVANPSSNSSDNGGTSGGLETRVTKLESDVGQIQRDVADVKLDVAEIKLDVWEMSCRMALLRFISYAGWKQLNNKMEKLHAEARDDIQALRAETQAGWKEMRAEARADTQALRAETQAVWKEMRAEARADSQRLYDRLEKLAEKQHRDVLLQYGALCTLGIGLAGMIAKALHWF